MALDGTYAGLAASILSFNWNRSSGTVDDAIVLSETRINLGLRIAAMQKTADITISAYRIAAPTDMLAPVRFWVDGNYDNPMTPTTPGLLADFRASYSAGQPTRYSIEGDTEDGSEGGTDGEYFVFGPDPGTTTYTAKLLYVRRLPSLLTVGTNLVLRRYPNLYLYAALDELGAYSDDPRTYGQRFEDLIARINTQAQSDATAGGPLQPKSPYT